MQSQQNKVDMTEKNDVTGKEVWRERNCDKLLWKATLEMVVLL